MNLRHLVTMPIGMILLAIAILMEKFLSSNTMLDFIEGVLIGLSIALNLLYVFLVSRKIKKEL
jgi:hypothetical protein